MGHKIISTGYIGSEPILRPAGNSNKLEFTVLSKRTTRPRGANDYVDVIEAVRFVAWGDEAIWLSEKLRPGVDVEAIGSQETSTFVNPNTKQEETRVTFKLIHLDLVRKSVPTEKLNRQDQRQAPSQPGRQREENADDGGSCYDGEPVQQRSPSGHQQQRNTNQGGALRTTHNQAQPQQRYARSSQANQSEHTPSGGGHGGGRFSGVY